MHRVDPKRKKKAALRAIAYSITLVLSVLTTIILLYIALGYRLDRESGHVVRSGLLLVDTKPEAAAIYINNEQKDSAAPGRFVLSAGKYDLSLRRNNYREVKKNIAVSASGVSEVNYIRMVPNSLKQTTIGETDIPTMVSQSQDKKFIITQVANQSNILRIEFNSESPTQTVLSLPSTVRREEGQIGVLNVIEWALDNKHVLLKQTLPSGSVNILSLDITKPEETINITSLYGAEAPEDVHYIGNNVEKIYGLKNGTLSRYSIVKKESDVVMQNVRSYQPYSDDTILFDRTSGVNSEVGIWHDSATTVIATDPISKLPALLKYARFDDQDYFAFARPDGAEVLVYKNPLKKPILAKQLPLAKIAFPNPSALSFGPSAQFLLTQNGSNFLTYDLDDLKAYSVALPFGVENGTISWMDTHYVQVRSDTGDVYMSDFDGQNIQKLVTVLGSTRIYFSNNYEYSYSFAAPANNRSQLVLTNFVAN